ATPPVVVHLRVPGRLVEAGVVPPVVQPVVDVEQVRHGGARLLRRGQRPQGQVVGAVEHAGSGDLGAQVAGAEAVRRLPVGVGIDVFAGADGRVVRQPGNDEGIEHLHGDLTMAGHVATYQRPLPVLVTGR